MSPRRFGFGILAALIVLFPWLPGVGPGLVTNANLAGEYAIIAISLVILTGWVGQISLGQGAFVGIGAFTTGLLVREFGIPFPLTLPLVALVTAAVASLLGVVALRVRGLYLAVATLIFAWMADAYLFGSAWLVGAGGASSIPPQVIGTSGRVPSFDLSDSRVFYLVIIASVAAVWYAASNLRASKTGRAFFALRGSEMAAASLGIDVTRYKLLAFALSGALAGMAGTLIMTDLRTVTPVDFTFTVSLFYLSIVVVGGIASLGGAAAAAIVFAGLNVLFDRVDALIGWFDVVSVALLLVVLLAYPGGLGALGRTLSGRLAGRPGGGAPPIEVASAGGRLPAPPAGEPAAPPVLGSPGSPGDAGPVVVGPAGTAPGGERLSGGETGQAHEVAATPATLSGAAAPQPADRSERLPVLEAEGITVRFGGLTAVDGVSLSVREREIVGLIGPNGAGKTTLFNAISGLNAPAEGRVRIFGEDATDRPVHERAAMGVGRTFQLIQLFPQLTVFDNLLVATHRQNPTGLFSHLLLTPRAVAAEAEARTRVEEVIGLLGLEDAAGREVAGLPFGVLRQVEIARALVTRSPLLMLDEPASGLDNTETDDLAQLLFSIRATLGVSILLIEHDVRMVTSVCDYMYVINRGRPLAEGTPREIRGNPDVVAAYLGEPAGPAPGPTAGPAGDPAGGPAAPVASRESYATSSRIPRLRMTKESATTVPMKIRR